MNYYEFFNIKNCSDKTKKKLEKLFAPQSFSPALYRYDSKCPVCRHILRPQIEELMYASASYSLIKDWLKEQGYQAPSDAVLKRHAKEHCPLKRAADERASMVFSSRVEEMTRSMVDASEALNVIINSFLEKVEGGEDLKVTATNVIRAVEAKHKIEGSAPMREVFARLYGKVIDGEVEEDVVHNEEEAGVVATPGRLPLPDREGASEGEVAQLDMSLLRREKLLG